MALAFQEAPPVYQALSTLPPDLQDHVRTYRKFVHRIALGFCAVPFFVAFVLYWTT